MFRVLEEEILGHNRAGFRDVCKFYTQKSLRCLNMCKFCSHNKRIIYNLFVFNRLKNDDLV